MNFFICHSYSSAGWSGGTPRGNKEAVTRHNVGYFKIIKLIFEIIKLILQSVPMAARLSGRFYLKGCDYCKRVFAKLNL